MWSISAKVRIETTKRTCLVLLWTVVLHLGLASSVLFFLLNYKTRAFGPRLYETLYCVLPSLASSLEENCGACLDLPLFGAGEGLLEALIFAHKLCFSCSSSIFLRLLFGFLLTFWSTLSFLRWISSFLTCFCLSFSSCSF